MRTALIDTGALLKLLYTSLLAGVSVAAVFSLAILGATLSEDRRREHRSRASAGYALLGAVALAAAIAIAVLGLVLLARKR